jgi:GTPase SAR1 family protein
MKLSIFDYMGNEIVLKILGTYYKRAHAAVFVYSVEYKNSFEAIEYRLKYLDTLRDNPKIVKILVANKRDLK